MRYFIVIAVAAISTMPFDTARADGPLDGAWTLSWSVIGSGVRSNQEPWCNWSESGDAAVTMVDGAAAGEIVSDMGNSSNYEIAVAANGEGTIRIQVGGNSDRDLTLPIRMNERGFKREFAQGRNCHSEIRMVR